MIRKSYFNPFFCFHSAFRFPLVASRIIRTPWPVFRDGGINLKLSACKKTTTKPQRTTIHPRRTMFQRRESTRHDPVPIAKSSCFFYIKYRVHVSRHQYRDSFAKSLSPSLGFLYIHAATDHGSHRVHPTHTQHKPNPSPTNAGSGLQFVGAF